VGLQRESYKEYGDSQEAPGGIGGPPHIPPACSKGREITARHRWLNARSSERTGWGGGSDT
jgi:hypothetical protein